MAITDKTRKRLWGKSGNRCAICKNELVIDSVKKEDESIVGEECHIISSKEGGPRFVKDHNVGDADSYDNLILLCRIHHKQVDDHFVAYTIEILRRIKRDHEKWVSETLGNQDKLPRTHIKRIQGNIPQYLKRFTKGKEILDVVSGHHAFSFDNDRLDNQVEVEKVGTFFDLIRDWSDIGFELSPGKRIEVEFDLTKNIDELEQLGFWVFGAKENQYLVSGEEKTDWVVAIVHVKRKTSSDIIKKTIDDLSG